MTSESNGCEHDDTWQQIGAMIDQVAGLSRSDVTERDFYESLLRAAVSAGAAVGGAVWIADLSGNLEQIAQRPTDGSHSANLGELDDARRALLARVRTTGDPASASVRVGRGDTSPQAAPSPVVACPIAVDDRVIRILEIVQRPDGSPAAQQGYIEVLSTFCELAADFHRRM